MIEKKIKTILKNLEKLGATLDDQDLEEMRNEANEKMFPELQLFLRIFWKEEEPFLKIL